MIAPRIPRSPSVEAAVVPDLRARKHVPVPGTHAELAADQLRGDQQRGGSNDGAEGPERYGFGLNGPLGLGHVFCGRRRERRIPRRQYLRDLARHFGDVGRTAPDSHRRRGVVDTAAEELTRQRGSEEVVWLVQASTASSMIAVGTTNIRTTFSSMIRIGFTLAVPKPGSTGSARSCRSRPGARFPRAHRGAVAPCALSMSSSARRESAILPRVTVTLSWSRYRPLTLP